MRRAPWIVAVVLAFVPCVASAGLGPNLIANPSFTTGTGSWGGSSTSNVTLAWDSASQSARATWIAPTSATHSLISTYQQSVPLTAGTTYTLSGRLSVTAAAGSWADANVVVVFGNGAGQFASMDTPYATANAGWATKSVVFVAPANTIRGDIYLMTPETNGASTLFDDIFLGTSDPLPVITFTATPSSITTGQSSTLNWSTQNATSVSINNGIGTVATSGSQTVTPASTTTYTLTATGAGGTVTRQATVVVTAPASPPVVSFSASPQSITQGSSSTLNWTTQYATSVSIDHGIGAVALTGSRSITPASTTTYTLTATGAGGTTVKQATVTVVSPGAPTIDFHASPATISAGQSSMLSWTTTRATSVSINNGIGTVPVNGSRAVSPAETATYTLTATGAGGQSTNSVTVTVNSATGAVIVVTSLPEGMVQVGGAAPATDEYVIANVGDAPSDLRLSQSGTFFTQAPATFTLQAGASQVVAITATSHTAGTYDGASLPSGTGVPSGLRIPVRLLVSSAPSSPPEAEPSVGRVEVSGPPDENPSGKVTFTNRGAGVLQGLAISDRPSLIPQSGIVTIDPGKSADVQFTIDRSKRPDSGAPLGAQSATLSLVYPYSVSVPVKSTSSVVLDTATPASTQTAPPPLSQGEVALFVPLFSAARTAGDLMFSSSGAPINDLKLYFTSPGSPPLATSLQLAPDTSVPFPSVIRTLFHSSVTFGTVQVRSGAIDRISVAAVQSNTTTSKGSYVSALPVFRSDQGVGSGKSLYLAGFDGNRGALLYVQEVAGFAATVRVDVLDVAGNVLTTLPQREIAAFALEEFSSFAPADIASVRITNISSTGAKIAAHAIIADATTADQWLVTDPQVAAGDRTAFVPIFPIAKAGVATELNLFNPNSASISVEYTFIPARSGHRRGIVPKSLSAMLEPASTRIAISPLHTLHVDLSGANSNGYVRISASGVFSGSARTSVSAGSAGTFGASLPLLGASDALSAGDSKKFSGVDSASTKTVAAGTPSTYRCGVGLIETKGEDATVTLTLRYRYSAGYVSASGRSSRTVSLSPNEALMIRDIRELLPNGGKTFGDLRNMELEVSVTSGNGRVVSYLAAVDNGSGDVSIRRE